MGSSIRFSNLSAATLASNTPSLAAASAISAALRPEVSKVVDLEATRTKATIVRGTESVETPAINPLRASGILEAFVPIPRLGEARSVKQSIAAGTLVARGTAIDVEFLAPNLVQLGLFEGVHADLRARTVSTVASLLDDPEVATALKKDATTLTTAERQNLSVKFGAAGVAVDDNDAEKSLGAAMRGLKSAQAFR